MNKILNSHLAPFGDYNNTQLTVAVRNVRKRFHRIATVRQEQGVTLRVLAGRLNLSLQDVRKQEDETRDLRISDLLRWQEALGVPLQHLLVDPEPTLSTPVLTRARMVRLKKTVGSLCECINNRRGERLLENMQQQLVDAMPELQHIGAWPSVGQRRAVDEYGRMTERCVDDRLVAD